MSIEEQIKGLMVGLVDREGSQTEVARKLGVTRAYVSQFMGDTSRGRIPEMLLKIVELAGMQLKLEAKDE